MKVDAMIVALGPDPAPRRCGSYPHLAERFRLEQPGCSRAKLTRPICTASLLRNHFNFSDRKNLTRGHQLPCSIIHLAMPKGAERQNMEVSDAHRS
jgi:hypothetical protein